MYLIRIKRSAEKELAKLPIQIVKRIVKAIDGLSENPRPSGCKKLEALKESLWRIRVGDYRIIYYIEDAIRIVEIRKVANRREVYD
ncbi:MAG TPA: type II toxin-antitoxin system mRNA interferase toxin, RelE/StbE family [Cytophagales bacterium]|nr:type II toxin-antitoxin system mRNA interferase toxin, RelE/StbE family [Cytophagales bacterium]HRG07211.1 type II toxin-antitoxin system RelE/ParE family toxin [Cyclobacteriaceae bacterium]